VRADPRLLLVLPEPLWLANIGIVLFWILDRSDGQRADLGPVAPVTRLIRLSQLRPWRPAVHQVLDLVAAVRDAAPLLARSRFQLSRGCRWRCVIRSSAVRRR
jgi:hypothetical protein